MEYKERYKTATCSDLGSKKVQIYVHAYCIFIIVNYMPIKVTLFSYTPMKSLYGIHLHMNL
jgi:hypothetical protein